MKTLIETVEDKLVTQISKFCSIYPTYAGLLKADATKISNLNEGSLFMIFVLMMQGKVQTLATAFTAYKDLVFYGIGGNTLGALPVLPVYGTTPAPPAVCLADVVTLFREVIQQCVLSGNLTEDIAKALGIFEATSIVVLEDGMPFLSLKSVSAGKPTLHTTIGNYEGFEIWKDSGKGFLFLDVSNSANYTDTSAMPATGVEIVWIYKVIYRYNNVQIGKWSNTISVAVKGNV